MRKILAVAAVAVVVGTSPVISDDDLLACLREHLEIEANLAQRAPAMIELTISNRLSFPISAVHFAYVVREEGRSVPWREGDIGLRISGGVEPGETRTIGAYSGSISSDASDDLLVDVELLDAADAGRNAVAGIARFAEWGDGPTSCP